MATNTSAQMDAKDNAMGDNEVAAHKANIKELSRQNLAQSRQMAAQQAYNDSIIASLQEEIKSLEASKEQVIIDLRAQQDEAVAACAKELAKQQEEMRKSYKQQIGELQDQIDRLHKQQINERENAVLKAVQAQQAEVTSLKSEVERLENEASKSILAHAESEESWRDFLEEKNRKIATLRRLNDVGPNSWIRFYAKAQGCKQRTYVERYTTTVWDALENVRKQYGHKWSDMILSYNGKDILDQKVTLEQLGIRAEGIIGIRKA